MKGCCLFGGYLLCSECRYDDDCEIQDEEDEN